MWDFIHSRTGSQTQQMYFIWMLPPPHHMYTLVQQVCVLTFTTLDPKYVPQVPKSVSTQGFSTCRNLDVSHITHHWKTLRQNHFIKFPNTSVRTLLNHNQHPNIREVTILLTLCSQYARSLTVTIWVAAVNPVQNETKKNSILALLGPRASYFFHLPDMREYEMIWVGHL